MKRVLSALLLIFILAFPVHASEITAPEAPSQVQEIMPEEDSSFMDGIINIIQSSLSDVRPAAVSAGKTCLSVLAIVLLFSLADQTLEDHKTVVNIGCALAISSALLSSSGALIQLGTETVRQLSSYGQLLLPVMTAALTAEGATGTSAALYAGTAFFDAFLGSLVTKILVPMIYIFLCVSIASAATGQDSLKKIQQFVKWLMTWSLKIVLYVFTGYMSITGVVSGSVDAAALKAAKLTISGVVPVVGGILSDASETILVGAGIMKNAAGIYGIFAIVALWVHPFLQIGIQYLMLRLTAAVASVLSGKGASGLVEAFCDAMGLLVAMTGAVCLMQLVSTVCFMRGVG